MEGLEHGDGHRIIATQQNGHGAGFEDGAGGLADGDAVGGMVGGIERQIAEIGGAWLIAVEQSFADVEVEMADFAAMAGHGGADGARAIGAISAVARIGGGRAAPKMTALPENPQSPHVGSPRKVSALPAPVAVPISRVLASACSEF